MRLFQEVLDNLVKRPSGSNLKRLVKYVVSNHLSDADLASLATLLAQSGRIRSSPVHSETADIASTGGPSSLATLLSPLYLRSFGYCVPKLGVAGRPAGGIDVMAQLILHFPIQGDTFPTRDWLTFLQTTRVIQRRLFDNGFPSRGAIASGKYFFRDGFLVGRPFMDTYRLSQNLEFVGAAMTAECFQRFRLDSKKGRAQWQRFPGGVEFLAPLKGNREEKLYCLCPLRKNEIDSEFSQNIHALVCSSFWRHDKDVPAAVDRKINNTVKFWTYWICRKKDA